MNPESLTLSVLNLRIKESIEASFPGNVWVTAEISEISFNPTGHCYLELIEKESNGDRILARMRATIWASTFRMLRPYFENTTGYRLSAGIKVLVNAGLVYHEVYGLSLNIKDIDPTYTLGDLARKKIEILNRLTSEGVIDMNRQLEMPVVPQRIAIISSETAAGYGDFMNTLQNNLYGFAFHTMVFPAIMQGDKAVASIISALEKIYEQEEDFDVVVVIRGGGAQADLDCFNHYDLAFHITQFPLPVLTGIGHERDETIADLVANQRLKTPTAVAGFLIDRLAEFFEYLDSCEQQVHDISYEIIRSTRDRLVALTRELSYLLNSKLSENRSYLQGIIRHSSTTIRQYFGKNRMHLEQKGRLTFLYSRNLIERQKSEIGYRMKEMVRSSGNFLHIRKEKLERFDRLNRSLDPGHILKRGFSITLYNGKPLTDSKGLSTGEEITTILNSGRVISDVKQLIKDTKNG